MRRRSYLVACLIIHASARAPKFEPYANNHGSAAVAAGADFVYLASDAQHVAGMTIASCQERQRGLTPRTRPRRRLPRGLRRRRARLVVEAGALRVPRRGGSRTAGSRPRPSRASCTGGGALVLRTARARRASTGTASGGASLSTAWARRRRRVVAAGAAQRLLLPVLDARAPARAPEDGAAPALRLGGRRAGRARRRVPRGRAPRLDRRRGPGPDARTRDGAGAGDAMALLGYDPGRRRAVVSFCV